MKPKEKFRAIKSKVQRILSPRKKSSNDDRLAASLTARVFGFKWRKKNKEQKTVCGCGRPLDAGWDCPYCRNSCPTCHRALGEGEQCERCQPTTN